MPLDMIGTDNRSLKLYGYYYQEKEVKSHPYYRNKYGGYSQDSSVIFNEARIIPLILYPDGTAAAMDYFTGLQDNSAFDFKKTCALADRNTIESAFAHFECYLKNEEYKIRTNFITRKAQIWDQGVYRIENNKITIQTFYNLTGNYYLYEESGDIINDSAFILKRKIDFRTGKESEISRVYTFRNMPDMPKIESYILKHKQKFRH